MRTNLAWLGAAVVGTVALLASSDAEACGGCFGPPPPPTEQPSIVTDHRMILSVSKEQTTLYDQIKYTGSPSSFAWVLPISGTVDVGLSADIVFSTLDGLSGTRVVAPPLNCPGLPASCTNSSFGGASASSPGYADAGAGSVQVTKEEVVGPYQTVQLHATDPAALETWLSQNGFSLPADVKPVVDQYVAEHFDFLALKLLPAKGVQDMRPVRVTSKGASAVLPLRMVAAGTGATVGITLWVVSEGRYEPTNFPSFHIADDDLVWDWTQSKSNFTELRAQKATETAGRGWELESSLLLYPQQVESPITNRYGGYPGYYPYGDDSGLDAAEVQAQLDYLPVKDEQGVVTKTAVQVRDEDLATLFKGIPTSTGRVTRLRADLAHTALTTDLLLGASADQGFLTNIRQVTRELNQPQCPVYSNCQQTGTAPRDEAIAAQSGGGTETFGCTTATSTYSSKASWFGVGLGAMALVAGRAVRRRKSSRG